MVLAFLNWYDLFPFKITELLRVVPHLMLSVAADVSSSSSTATSLPLAALGDVITALSYLQFLRADKNIP